MKVIAFTNRRPWVVEEPLKTVGDQVSIISLNKLNSDSKDMNLLDIIYRTKHKIKADEYDAVFVDSLGSAGLIALLFAIYYRYSYIIRLGGDPQSVRIERIRGIVEHNPFQWKLIKLLVLTIVDRVIMRFASGCIVVSESVKREVCSLIAAPSERIKIVHQPPNVESLKHDVDQGSDSVNSSEENSNDNINIVTVTNLKYKGKFRGVVRIIEDIEEVLSENQDARYIVAGDGPYYDKLKTFVNNTLDNPNVRSRVALPGFVNHIGQVYEKGDILVYVSYIDGYPNVPLEAQSMGIPVIANADHGITEQIEDGETGILVDPRNPKELKESISYLIDYPEERRRMGEQAQKKVLENSRKEKIGEQLYDAIKKIHDEIQSD